MSDKQHDVEELLEETLSGASISIGAMFFKQAMQGLLALVITRGAGAAVYGVVSALEKLEGFVSLATGGVTTTAKRTIPRYSKSVQDSIKVGLYSLEFLITSGIALVLIIFDDFLIRNTVLKQQHSSVVVLLGIVLVSMALIHASNSIFKGLRMIKSANLVGRVIKPLSKLLSALLVIFLLGIYDVFGVWTGITGALVFSAVAGIFLVVRYTGFSLRDMRASGELIEDIKSYLPSALLNNIAVATQLLGSYVLMGIFLPPVQAGAFSIGLLAATFTRWPLRSINQIFPPIASKLYSDKAYGELRQIYRTTSKLIFTAIIPIVAVLTVYADSVMLIFSPKYVPYASSLQLMVIAMLVATVVGSVGYLLMMTDNEAIAYKTEFVLAAITLPVAVFLVYNYGIIGLAAGYAFSYIFNNLVELALLYWREGLQPFTVRHLYLFALGLSLTALLVASKNYLTLAAQIVLGLGLVAGFYLFSYRDILSRREKDLVSTVFSRN